MYPASGAYGLIMKPGFPSTGIAMATPDISRCCAPATGAAVGCCLRDGDDTPGLTAVAPTSEGGLSLAGIPAVENEKTPREP